MTAQLRSNAGSALPCMPPPAPVPAPPKVFKPGLYGPAVAAQYAATITRFWRECQRAGRLDADQPLDIIDLCPGDDPGGGLLLAAIERRLHGTGLIRVRYLPANFDDETPAAVQAASAHWVLSGQGTTLAWREHAGLDECDYVARNPVVMIAHDAWAQLPQQLFAVHYGKLLQADLPRLLSEEPEGDEKLWSPVNDSQWDPALHALLCRYRTELNSAPLVYPTAAYQILDHTRLVAPAGLMVLTCATGIHHDLGLRLSSFVGTTAAFRRSGRLPLNFQLLGSWARTRGGGAGDIALPGGQVLQVMVLGAGGSEHCLSEVLRCVDPATIGSAPTLAELARSLGSGVSLDSRLELLKLSRFDPQVFFAASAGIIRAMGASRDHDRRSWRHALESIWDNYLRCPTVAELHQPLAQAAMHSGAWGLARSVLRDELRRHGDSAAALANLAWCEARTGSLALALSLAARALALEPEHTLANEVRRRLDARLAERDQRWRVELRHPQLPLVIEPLDETHAEALSYQYRDPQIAIMTGLPAMAGPDEVRKWIAEQHSDAGRVNFAVMHADWGFVGFINLAVSAHAAFFCFWTGVDYQGLGYATAAGRLACAHAASVGVPVMLTSAYKDNHRSVRALKRMGFAELPIRALAPDQDRIFFSMVDPLAGEVDAAFELRAYYQRENLPLAFDPATYVDAAGQGASEEKP